MPTENFVVGDANAPVPTTSKFTSDFLKKCFVNFIFIDNNRISPLYPNPDFIHSYTNGFVDISPNVWVAGSKITFDITPLNPCSR